ncbi:MAG: hypothetical protein ACREAD_00655 [Nitrosopumilaceae archaeon]
MNNLERVVKSGIRSLEKEAEKSIRFAIKTGTLHVWKNRKIISVKEWESKIHTIGNQPEFLQYIPEDYVNTTVFYSVAKDEKEEEERKEWFNDWREFLDHKKNPAYGKYMCRQCILNPSSKIQSTSIRNVMVKYLDKNIKFPCIVVNMFQCPYEQLEKDYTLLWLGEVWRIVDDALRDAHNLTTHNNSKTLEANFETGWVDNHWSRSYDTVSTGSLEIELRNFRISKVPIKEIKDIYNVLTDKKKLDVILEQYIKDVASGTRYAGETKAEAEKKADSISKLKGGIIDLFASIKDEIKLEELRNLSDETLADEENAKKIGLGIHYVDKKHADIVRSGSCYSCKEFANIHCINCDIWICPDHWREHGADSHNKKIN